jgi:hypothetical protein
LERVTKQAYSMVVYFGLNKKLGNISYYDSTGQSEYALTKPYSENTAEIIDIEVGKIIEVAYARAKKIIEDNKDKVAELAHLLLEKEVIFREDVEKIFGKRPFDDQKQMDEDARDIGDTIRTTKQNAQDAENAEHEKKDKVEDTGSEPKVAELVDPEPPTQ